MHARTHAHTHAHTHTRTHARTHARTDSDTDHDTSAHELPHPHLRALSLAPLSPVHELQTKGLQA